MPIGVVDDVGRDLREGAQAGVAAGMAMGLLHERRQRIGAGDAGRGRAHGEARVDEARDGQRRDRPQRLTPPVPETGGANDRHEAYERGRRGIGQAKAFGHEHGGGRDHATEGQ